MAKGEYECWGHFAEPWGLKAYVTWMTVAVFLLPALIITICQVKPAAAARPVAWFTRSNCLKAAGNVIQQRSVWHE